MRNERGIPAIDVRAEALATIVTLAFALTAAGCSRHREGGARPADEVVELRVAAASSLTGTLEALGDAFARSHRVRVVRVFGSTGALAREIEEGLPVDVFLSADVETPNRLAAGGHLAADTVHPFARGVLVLFSRADASPPVAGLPSLSAESVRRIAIANPEHAPFGRAAREALTRTGQWDALEARIVTAENVREAFEFARTGNADAALTARSVTMGVSGNTVVIDPALYAPIDESLGVLSHSQHAAEARAFCEFVRSPAGGAILTAHGFAPIR